ncbi:MAG: four helix bundle protein [Patescibacteria group bacterium]|nr:four helix bundle protein [Patescibacteria group bacterium]
MIQPLRSYRDLIVWQKSKAFVKNAYVITASFPPGERFGLASQMRRAAVSIPSNIAEGRGRSTRKDFVSFLRIALGSVYELETQFEIAKDLGFVSDVPYCAV